MSASTRWAICPNAAARRGLALMAGEVRPYHRGQKIQHGKLWRYKELQDVKQALLWIERTCAP